MNHQNFNDQDFNDVFALFDVWNTNQITIDEFCLVLGAINPKMKESEITALFNEADVKDKESLSKKKMIRFFRNKMNQKHFEDEIMIAFQVFDRDGDGYISKKDIVLISEHVDGLFTEKQIDKMIDYAKPDSNEMISYEKFRAMILKKADI